MTENIQGSFEAAISPTDALAPPHLWQIKTHQNVHSEFIQDNVDERKENSAFYRHKVWHVHEKTLLQRIKIIEVKIYGLISSYFFFSCLLKVILHKMNSLLDARFFCNLYIYSKCLAKESKKLQLILFFFRFFAFLKKTILQASANNIYRKVHVLKCSIAENLEPNDCSKVNNLIASTNNNSDSSSNKPDFALIHFIRIASAKRWMSTL